LARILQTLDSATCLQLSGLIRTAWHMSCV
jgi:hypothetical protein